MTGDMRILEGWTDKERKELERASNGGYKDAFGVIRGIINEDSELFYIGLEYDDETHLDNNQLVKDIVDYYAGVAKFAEPKKYYVHLIKDDENSYLNITSDGGAELDNKFEFGGWQTKFTRDEVIAIDSKLVPFMEEVEDDEQSKNNRSF